MVVHRGNFSLASLIILAGFQISRVMWITQAHSQGTLMAHLFRIKSRPLSLSEQTRIFIRKKFGEKVTSSVQKLNLPSCLKQFLLLNDIKDIDV
ncbi:hypothetical protein Avbf_04421 [Armadillidium vulgare]|nr:hypothetical protein Avbf_04421 [Armadillidium vulgare]